ncbi:hypothetical protein CI109_102082 [Kwoniella shandongensis]|uniref:Uncharacterized protein n=1 Tax=Kwoniella shandongensis TaxID=1734106 RepID=A0A5M6BSY5_9TREE|nr:uncharacterized protein CI109_006510 [Kwoniella shandongensis]KAA5525140.1 hypothetical protein CI109_006510 [Kwoniella shandongensis]
MSHLSQGNEPHQIPHTPRSPSPQADELFSKLSKRQPLDENERAAVRKAFLEDTSFLIHLQDQNCTEDDEEIDTIIADYAYWLLNPQQPEAGGPGSHENEQSELSSRTPYLTDDINAVNAPMMQTASGSTTTDQQMLIGNAPHIPSAHFDHANLLLEKLFPTDPNINPTRSDQVYQPASQLSTANLSQITELTYQDLNINSQAQPRNILPSVHTYDLGSFDYPTASQEQSATDLEAYYLNFFNNHIIDPPVPTTQGGETALSEPKPESNLGNLVDNKPEIESEPERASSDLDLLPDDEDNDDLPFPTDGETTDDWESPSESDDEYGDPSYGKKWKKSKRAKAHIVIQYQRVFGSRKASSSQASFSLTKKSKSNDASQTETLEQSYKIAGQAPVPLGLESQGTMRQKQDSGNLTLVKYYFYLLLGVRPPNADLSTLPFETAALQDSIRFAASNEESKTEVVDKHGKTWPRYSLSFEPGSTPVSREFKSKVKDYVLNDPGYQRETWNDESLNARITGLFYREKKKNFKERATAGSGEDRETKNDPGRAEESSDHIRRREAELKTTKRVSETQTLDQDKGYDADTDQGVMDNKKGKRTKKRCRAGGNGGRGCGVCWTCMYEWGTP